MRLSDLVNQLLASDKGHDCEHNLLECDVVFRPAFGHGLYANETEPFSVDYDPDDDVIVVLVKDSTHNHCNKEN